MNDSAIWIILHRMRTPFLVLIITYTIAIIGLLLIDGVDSSGNTYHLTIFDAFYIVTYTATTIGFGELPYEFTYAQRIWMSMIIYATVMGWFYSIGSLVALFQDKLLLKQITEARFIRQVKNISEEFIIVLGYNFITKQIIQKATKQGIRTVVIEKDEQKANELFLENYTPYVPCLMDDIYNPDALIKAGINRKNCKAVISLFKDDKLNLRSAITIKLLNKNVKLAVKSTTGVHTQDLKNLGVEIIENPFELITEQISMLINNPYLLSLQKWLYKVEPLSINPPNLPRGKFIVCGFGRMGKVLYQMAKNNNIDITFIEISKSAMRGVGQTIRKHILFGSGDNEDTLIKAGIDKAKVIVAATDDDTLNLAILALAKRLNPDIKTIARENETIDLSIFESAKIDYVFVPSLVLIRRTINELIAPYSSEFLKYLKEINDIEFTKNIIKKILQSVGEISNIFGIKIDNKHSKAIYNELNNGLKVKLEIFSYSLKEKNKKNKILPLILIRDKKRFLIPNWNFDLKTGDKILFVADEEVEQEVVTIAENDFEFHFAYYGEEKNNLLFWRKK